MPASPRRPPREHQPSPRYCPVRDRLSARRQPVRGGARQDQPVLHRRLSCAASRPSPSDQRPDRAAERGGTAATRCPRATTSGPGARQVQAPRREGDRRELLAVREWDSNGTNFGYNPELGTPPASSGTTTSTPSPSRPRRCSGPTAPRRSAAWCCTTRSAGRLAEVFSLKTYKIDHVRARRDRLGRGVRRDDGRDRRADRERDRHGRGALRSRSGRSARASSSATPRASSAAISTEFAILSVKRSMAGFLGPRDIFRNPEAIFRIFEGPGQMFQKVDAPDANTEKKDASPFELCLGRRATTSPSWACTSSSGCTSTSRPARLQAMTDLLDNRPALLLMMPRARTSRDQDHGVRARVRHHRRPREAQPDDAAVGGPLDGLHRRDPAAQGSRTGRRGSSTAGRS
jgi:hypothetical protein